MGKRLKPDAVLKEYWKNNERFADFFNAVLFGGREVIHASQLEERVQKPIRKRRKKAEKEVLGEGEQIRFDGYLFEPETAQADTPELAPKKTENAPSEIHKISKPNV